MVLHARVKIKNYYPAPMSEKNQSTFNKGTFVIYIKFGKWAFVFYFSSYA